MDNFVSYTNSASPVVEQWKHDGVQVTSGDCLDLISLKHQVCQDLAWKSMILNSYGKLIGMNRAARINFARAGAQKLSAGTITIHPNAKPGAYHYGHLESIIYIVKGKAHMRWGERLEFTADAGTGDFIFVPPYVLHQEINALEDETLECVLVRSDGQAMAVNLSDLRAREL